MLDWSVCMGGRWGKEQLGRKEERGKKRMRRKDQGLP
jgi:hypothetical protein